MPRFGLLTQHLRNVDAASGIVIGEGARGISTFSASNSHGLIAAFDDQAQPWQDQPEALFAGLQVATGIDFRQYRQTAIRRQLEIHLAGLALDSVGEYLEYAREHPEDWHALAERLLVTYGRFFRNPSTFDYLEREVLPRLTDRARSEQRALRIWSAGCATGEEAYSLAMLAVEQRGEGHWRPELQIVGTDVNAPAIQTARRGEYDAAALSDVPPRLMSRFLRRTGATCRIERLRDQVCFLKQDLLCEMPRGQFDLIMCRYVVLFWADENRRRVLRQIMLRLRPGGYLVLGEREADWPLEGLLLARGPRQNVYVRLATSHQPE